MTKRFTSILLMPQCSLIWNMKCFNSDSSRATQKLKSLTYHSGLNFNTLTMGIPGVAK